MNLPLSLPAWGAAELAGGSCSWNKKNQILVCKDIRVSWADGPAGGIAIGSVYLTEAEEVDACVKRHEGKHSNQWAVYGPAGFLVGYVAGEAVAAGSNMLGDDDHVNFMESQAGLKDGGYVSSPCRG